MVTNITVSYNQRDGKLVVLEAEDSEEKKETVINEKEIFKYVFEVNLESFIYCQQYDYTYSLYLLRKADKVVNVFASSNDSKSILDERILIDNNIAFLYMKMGAQDKAIARVEQCLAMVCKERTKIAEMTKSGQTRPDFFDTRCEKIKYKKVKARLNLSLCILHSEKLE